MSAISERDRDPRFRASSDEATPLSVTRVERRYFPVGEWTIGFEWFKQPVTETATSAIFRRMLRQVGTHTEDVDGKLMAGLHGVLFSNGVFAWSKDVKKHDMLELAGTLDMRENPTVQNVAEIEVSKWQDQRMIVDVRGWNEVAIKRLAQYVSRNTDPIISTGYLYVYRLQDDRSLYKGVIRDYR